METAQLLVIAQAKDEASAILGKMEGSIGGLGKAAMIGFAAVGTAAVAAGAALFKIGADFDDAYDSIRIATGKTGEALEGLKGDMKAVMTDIPTDMKSASAAIGDLNTRLGLTGEPLQTMTKQFLELSRITGTEVSENVRLMTRVFGDWGISAEDQSSTMDLLFRATQETGIGLGELQAKVVQFGAPLRAMGFSLNESVAMLGKWEKEGVNSELVLGSLRIAMGNFAEAGVPMRKGLMDTVKRIQELGPSAEATSLAMKTFGARAGPDMAAAILEGRFAYEDLLAAIEGGSDTIMGVGKDTMDAAEKFDILKNRAMVLIEPLASGLFGALSNLADVLLGMGPTVEAFGKGLDDLLTPILSFAQYIRFVLEEGDYLNDFLMDIPEPLREIVKGFGEVIAVVRSVRLYLGALTSGAENASDVLQTIPVPVQAVIAILSGLAEIISSQVFPVLANLFKNIDKWFTELAPLIGPAIDNVIRLLAWLQEQIGAFITTVGEWWARHGEDVIRIFKGLWEVVQGIFEVAFSLIGGIIKIFLALIGGDFEAAGLAWEQMWQGVWDGIERLFSGALEVITAILWVYVTTFGEIAQRIAEAMWDALSPGLDRLVDLARGWIDRFLAPFRAAWDQVKGLFGWMIGGSVIPDMLESGLNRMLDMSQDFGAQFASSMGDAGQFAADAFNAGMGALGWPVTPKLSDEAIAKIMLEKMPNLKKIMEEAGKGALSPIEMIQDWWNWPGVREGFGSWQELAAGKGWLPKAPEGPRVTPSSRALMDAFRTALPFSINAEEAANTAVKALADQIKTVSGGKVTVSAEDMQKWWNQIMGQWLTEKVNAPFELTTSPTTTAPKPVAIMPTTTPKPTAAQNITVNLTGLFLAPDRSIAEQLARVLKPELDALTRLAV